MFKNPAPIGDTFEFLGQNFVVSGVLNQIDASPLSQKANFNNTIFIEYSTAERLLNGRVPIYEILARPTDANNIDPTVAGISQALEKAHGQHDFQVLTQQQSIKAASSVLDLITEMTVGVAAVALLVGGIGIMDIMLVSISERVSEIGLRKAVGASNRQILDQFVVEASVLSIIGAIVGTILALIACYIIFIFSDITPRISWQAIFVADAVALIVGLVFGTIPALKAARKDPIQALRHE
jgi:putative ABC transport system permease protein